MSATRKSVINASLIIGCAFALLAAIIAFAVEGRRQALGQDLCKQSGPSGIFVVAVDATDTLTPVQKLDVENRVGTAVHSLPANWRTEVWTVAPASGVARRLGTAWCRPDGDVSALMANPRRAKEREQEFFRQFDKISSQALEHASSNASPILEALQAIGLRSFGDPSVVNVKQRRLLLVSDLIQNTDQLSFLRATADYSSFRNSSNFDVLRPPLQGVDVRVLLLTRSSAQNAGALVRWWQMLFADAGAALTGIDRVVG